MNATFDILIISDTSLTCNTARTFCNSMGCFKNIVFAHDQITASRKLLNQKFSVILIDIDMGLNIGFKVLDEIDEKSKNKTGSICVVCNVLEKSTIEKIASKKIKHVLVKPLEQVQFQQHVLKILSVK